MFQCHGGFFVERTEEGSDGKQCTDATLNPQCSDAIDSRGGWEG